MLHHHEIQHLAMALVADIRGLEAQYCLVRALKLNGGVETHRLRSSPLSACLPARSLLLDFSLFSFDVAFSPDKADAVESQAREIGAPIPSPRG